MVAILCEKQQGMLRVIILGVIGIGDLYVAFVGSLNISMA